MLALALHLCVGFSVPRTGWVLGANKYSHDAGVALLSTDGKRSIIVPNERLSRVKHDAGDISSAVSHALSGVGATLDDVVVACSNNHHHRVAPFEARLPWSVGLGTYPASALDPENLLPDVPRHELSHHLAHAWSVITQAPFERGLVVVMDGMGERSSAFDEAMANGDESYMHDLRLEAHETFSQVPERLELTRGSLGYREAESAYTFGGDGGTELKRVWKRWTEHRSPPELYNHGFADLESLGALYSRASSHIFGDWNACGKVMGLGPWASRWASREQRENYRMLLGGHVDGTGSDALRIDWPTLDAMPHPAGFSALLREAGGDFMKDEQLAAGLRERRGFYTALAERVQLDLEDQALGLLKRLQQRTGETNLCLVGGVVQNSVLNGRIAREAGFENIWIPPYPGDEGIALGCAAYAQQVLLPAMGTPRPPRRTQPLSAYQGTVYTHEDVDAVIEEYSPWLEEVQVEGPPPPTPSPKAAASGSAPLPEGGAAPGVDCPEEVIAYAARALADGEIIGWCHGRAEVGARALGHRSILANPALPTMHKRANVVKQRMPIVESPADALSCFLDADDDLSLLVLYGRVLRRRAFPEGDAAGSATPRQQRSFISRCVSDNTGDELLRSEVLVEGAWLPLTPLQLEVLECCADGDVSMAELAAGLAAESDDDFGAADVVESLRHLYALRLIAFE